MFTFRTSKPLKKHKTRITFFRKWWEVIRVSFHVTTDHPSSGVHVASGQRSGEKVPSMAPHPAMKGPDTSPSPEWKLHTYDGCRPSKGYDEKNSSVGLLKGGRKCVLLMLALSTKVVLVSPIYYSPSFHHSIPCLSFLPLSMPACLAFKGGSQNTQMHEISWFAQTSVKRKTAIALQRWASVKLIIHGKVASHKGYIATWAMWALGRGQSCQQAGVHIIHSKGFIPISSQIKWSLCIIKYSFKLHIHGKQRPFFQVK